VGFLSEKLIRAQALTVITPILVRLSASANLLDHNEMKNGDIQSGKGVGLSSRRALGSIGRPQEARRAASLSPSPSPSPSPSSKPHRRTAFDLEAFNDAALVAKSMSSLPLELVEGQSELGLQQCENQTDV
ncbi:hypothetical protein Tco_1180349, partial [Tanacetum coccineum]